MTHHMAYSSRQTLAEDATVRCKHAEDQPRSVAPVKQGVLKQDVALGDRTSASPPTVLSPKASSRQRLAMAERQGAQTSPAT